MFRKLFIITAIFISMFTCTASANDPYYQMGQNIGNSLGAALAQGQANKGDVEKSFYYDDKFSLKPVKKILYFMEFPPETISLIDEPSISLILMQMIDNEAKEKENYKLFSLRDASMRYIKLHPEDKDLSNPECMDRFINFTKETMDALLTVKVLSYNSYGSTSNVKLDYYISPMNNLDYDFFIYSESRTKVIGKNTSKVLKIINNHFFDKLDESYEKSYKN